jgi:hypothetical protein
MSLSKPHPSKPTLLERLRHDRGATFVEYILLVGIVAIGVIAGWRRARERENAAVVAQARVVAQLEVPDGFPPLLLPTMPPVGGVPSPRPPILGGCFAAGTLVATADGLRPIEIIREGDLVWSRDEATGEIAHKPVIHRYVTPAQPVMELAIAAEDGGEIIRPTTGHRFWATGHGWVEAANLSAHDGLFSPSGEPLHVGSQSGLDELRYETVYNFEIADFHTYFVGQHGIWVHNGGPTGGGTPSAGGLPQNPCSAQLPPSGPRTGNQLTQAQVDARMQQLATRAYQNIMNDPALLQSLLTQDELDAANEKPFLKRVFFGTAVERELDQLVRNDPTLNGRTAVQSGSGPDYTDSKTGRNYDVTTDNPATVAEHKARGYPNLLVLTYPALTDTQVDNLDF